MWNSNKCVITFIKNQINFYYSISKTTLKLVYNFKDLKVILDCKLNFSNHIEIIKNKKIHNLGFIKRTHWFFNERTTLKHYCLYVPFNKYNINNTNKQNKVIVSIQNILFTIHLFQIEYISKLTHGSYQNVISFFNVFSLNDRP